MVYAEDAADRSEKGVGAWREERPVGGMAMPRQALGMHRILVDGLSAGAGGTVAVDGEEARHALRVKRVRMGEKVELMDGRGGVALGVVVEADEGGKKRDGSLVVRVESVRHVDPERPRVEVWTAAAKGGRVDDLVDQLSQAGATKWRPLEAARSVSEPREAKMERLERIACEASKQCGRAWVMEIGPMAGMEEAVRGGEGVRVVVCDAAGEPWRAEMGSGAEVIRLLVGPEGGWTAEELGAARAAGAVTARFGPHVMRIETAGVVACGVVRAG
jgi:16S rRNA (uracil1498-N3)-methyltransferase